MQLIQHSPYIWSIIGFMSSEICQTLIEQSEARGYQKQGQLCAFSTKPSTKGNWSIVVQNISSAQKSCIACPKAADK